MEREGEGEKSPWVGPIAFPLLPLERERERKKREKGQ